jgi:hypothetical protein
VRAPGNAEGGGGEALSASCWPGGGAAAGGKDAQCAARGGGLQVRGGAWHCAVLYCLNKAQISPPHQAKCPPLPPEDGRFDPTSPTSIDSS